MATSAEHATAVEPAGAAHVIVGRMARHSVTGRGLGGPGRSTEPQDPGGGVAEVAFSASQSSIRTSGSSSVRPRISSTRRMR